MIEIRELDRRYNELFQQRDIAAQQLAKGRIEGADREDLELLEMLLNDLDEVGWWRLARFLVTDLSS